MVRFVVALPAEAKPLVETYRLEAQEAPFGFFRRDDIGLVVSGVGKSAAAAATAYLHARMGESLAQIWFNIGVAGHRDHEIGNGYLAHAITEATTGRRWYPPRITTTSLVSDALTTVDCVETEFATNSLYDMEAAGFYPTALRFSTAELVQCFKIVSDNRETSGERIDASLLERLVSGRLAELQDAVASTQSLAEELHKAARAPRGAPEFEARWHFTTTEGRRLRKLLARWDLLHAEPALSSLDLDGARRAGQVLDRLEGAVRSASIDWDKHPSW